MNDSNFTAGFGYGLNVTKNFTHTFGLQAELTFGTLRGKRVVGDNSFVYEGTVKYEALLRAVINFGNIFSTKKESKFLVYAAAGIGWGGYDAKFKMNAADWVEVNDNMATIIPLALGAKYRLSQRLDLCLEYEYRFTNSDMIDGIKENLSSVGVTNPLLTSENNDSYSSLDLGVTYHFGKSSQSMEWTTR
jgi:OOP family OmpA-OmpF porin